MESLNFMIVDDSSIMIKNLTHMLSEMGHKVVGTAKTGEIAVNEFQNCNPDIITMDITMPDMNGIDATEKILEKDPSMIIIMITALGQEQLVVNSISKGAKGYLIKPITFAVLKDTVEKIHDRYCKKA